MPQRPASQTSTIDVGEAKRQLSLLLTQATDPAFARFTVDGLARMNRSPRAYIVERLAVEQARRAVRG